MKLTESNCINPLRNTNGNLKHNPMPFLLPKLYKCSCATKSLTVDIVYVWNGSESLALTLH